MTELLKGIDELPTANAALTSMESKAFAKMLKDAANCYSMSYDHAAANARAEIERKDHPDNPYAVDYNQFYAKSLHDACIEVAGALGYPMYLLLESNWNDALDWAREQLEA